MIIDRETYDARILTRGATAADAEAVAQTLANAFFDDPLISFLLKERDSRAVGLPRLFKLLFKLGLPHGLCDIAEGCESVALWRPPHQWHIPLWHYIANGAEFLSIFGLHGAARVMRTMDHIEKRHPRAPHLYLQALGTDPSKQGKGFAGAVMRRQLMNADALSLPAFLESTKAENIPIYERNGFELTGEIELPGGGPTIYPMWRRPIQR